MWERLFSDVFQTVKKNGTKWINLKKARKKLGNLHGNSFILHCDIACGIVVLYQTTPE